MANSILLGQAEEIDLVQPQVRAMLAVDGIYIGGDTDRPELTVPLAVVDGRVYSLELDAELAPERFNPTLTLHGPYRAATQPADRTAIRMLVAGGHVTEAKANEALNIAHGFDKGPLTPQARPDRDAYEGAREDLLDWKGRAQRAEARLRSLGWKGIDASEPAPTADGGAVVYFECRQCDECDHTGINDEHPTDSACHDCDWSGPAPVEDKCPGCEETDCMATACPKCGARYRLLAEYTHIAPAPGAARTIPVEWREFVGDCAKTAGGMVSGNTLATAALELLSGAQQGGA
ncbi:MAG: hypothetical protein ACREO4_06435 [Lysobacter sp.]